MPKVSIIIPVYNTEQYLTEMLESVRNQTFKDFEAIIVNDGSTDNSQEIVETFCAADNRFSFVLQKNGGLSSARNTGLGRAVGDYVTFYDSDDSVPIYALEAMVNVADENDSDLVVGTRSDVVFSTKKINRPSMRFAERNEISKFDSDFVNSFSVCNKLFRRAIIEDNSLRFVKGSRIEDGLFVFSFLTKCETINGCKEEVYEYKKRTLFDAESSLSQSGRKETIESIHRDFNYLKENYISYIDSFDLVDKEQIKHAFEQKLIIREINLHLLNQFYRRIWTLDSEAVDLAIQLFNELAEQLDDEMRDTLRDAHLDIDLDNALRGKREIVEKPEIAIVITNAVSNKNLGKVLGSIYAQLSPCFTIYASDKKKAIVDKEYKEKENFSFLRASTPRRMLTKAMEQTNADCFIVINEDIVLDKSTLVVLVKFLKRHRKYDIATAPVFALNTEIMKSEEVRCICQLYEKALSQSEIKRNNLEWFDCLFGNKVIRRKALEKPATRKAFIKMDCNYLNRKLKLKRKTTTEVFVLAEEKEIIGLCKNRKAVRWYRRKAGGNGAK